MFFYVGARASITYNDKEKEKEDVFIRNINYQGQNDTIGITLVSSSEGEEKAIDISLNKFSGEIINTDSGVRNLVMKPNLKVGMMVNLSLKEVADGTVLAKVIKIDNVNQYVQMNITSYKGDMSKDKAEKFYIPFNRLDVFDFIAAQIDADDPASAPSAVAPSTYDSDDVASDSESIPAPDSAPSTDVLSASVSVPDSASVSASASSSSSSSATSSASSPGSTSATAPSEALPEDEYEDDDESGVIIDSGPVIQDVQAKEEMINNMWDDLTPVQRKNPNNVKLINNECDNIFALVDAYNETARDIIFDTDGSSLSKILRKYTGDINNSERGVFRLPPSLPLWILPVDGSVVKKTYVSVESTYENVNYFLREINNNTSNRRDLVRDFTRPFQQSRTQLTFSSRTQSIFETADVINSEKISAADIGQRTISRNNVMQVFTPYDKVNIEKLCCLKDLRDYSRAFLPNTSIYDTIQLTDNQCDAKINGVLQDTLQSDPSCDENLPSLKDNIDYVKSLVLKDPSKFNILLNNKLFVDKLNFNDFFWHDMNKRDLNNLNTIKEYQILFKNYLKETTKYPTRNAPTLKTPNLELFNSDNYGDECGDLSNEIIKDYMLQKTRITNSEALDIIINSDYGDAYYKYSNFCNTDIAMMGGDLDIEKFTITKRKQLSGRKAINNLFGEERVVTDFERTDVKNVEGKLNLSYVCLICDKSSDDKLCVNEGGRIDVGIIIKSIELLGYEPRVFPGTEESNRDTCYSTSTMGGSRNEIMQEAVEDIFNARDNLVAALTYVGSIIYSKNKYLTLKYDGKRSKETLLYFHVDNDNELITNVAFNYDSVLDLLQSIDATDEEEEEDTDTFTIINVHLKRVIDDEEEGRSEYSESEYGTPPSDDRTTESEFSTPPSEEGSLTYPGSPLGKPPSEISYGSELSGEEQELGTGQKITMSLNKIDIDSGEEDEGEEVKNSQAQLEEYIVNIQKSINDFDNYLCRALKEKYKNEMIRSFVTLSRLRYMENSRLLKYQMDNYVRVSAIIENDLYYNALIGRTSNQTRSVYYSREISRAFSDTSRCWSMIQDIANSLGDNYVEQSYSVGKGESQVWLETIANEETVRVMPYYYLEISECIVYGVGTLYPILVKLKDNNSIEIREGTCICRYTGVDLNLKYAFNNDDTMSSSGTLLANDTDSRPVSPNFIESTNSSNVSVSIKFIISMLKFIFTENILANTNEVNLFISECSKILIATYNKNKGLEQKIIRDKLIGLSSLVMALSLQSSSYFCKLRTTSSESRKEGIPVLPLTNEEGKNVYSNLLKFILGTFFNKSKSEEIEIKVQVAEELVKDVQYYNDVMEIIKRNQEYLLDNTVSYEWYVKQWSSFSPPLFPIKNNEVSMPPSPECLKNIKYSNKFKYLHYIDTLAISGMKSADDATSKKTTDLLREYEKLVDVCYNVPSTARFIVQSKELGTKEVSQIEIFEFTEDFKKKFLEFYCKKGDNSVLELKECEDFKAYSSTKAAVDEASAKEAAAVQDNKNNQKWFYTVLKEVNKQHMIKNFNQENVDNINQSVDSDSHTDTDKVSENCKISTDEYRTLSKINERIKNFHVNFNNFIVSEDVNLNIEKCQFPENIKDSFNNLMNDAMSIKGLNYGSTHNFWQNNMSRFVNVMFWLWIKKRKDLSDEVKDSLKSWYNCWKDNLKYMGYNSRDAFNAIDDKVNEKKSDEDMESKEEKGYNLIKYLIQYVICMALASPTSVSDSVNIMHSFISDCLDEIKKNFNCIYKSDTKIEEELRNQKAAERRRHKTLSDGLDSNELRKRLKSAGIHEHLNAQRRRDLGLAI